MPREERRGRLYLIMGKSATGKDHIYRDLLERLNDIRPVVPYTTRPMREGEVPGREYNFIDEAKRLELESAGRIIESRCYQTVFGPWYYMTVDDGSIDLSLASYMLIVTPLAFEEIQNFFGSGNIVPVYIESPDGDRLKRAIKRAEKQDDPAYAEVCRRYLADEADFSEEVLGRLGIKKRFVNIDYDSCLNEIEEYITKIEASLKHRD